MKILVTGATGFVGKNLISYISFNIASSECIPLSLRYGDTLTTRAQVYIHLSGKAHDTSNILDEKEYYEANYLLTKSVYDAFLADPTSECFIYMSSVKAIADNPGDCVVNEEYEEIVKTIYGKSKKLAEEYIISKKLSNKRIYILRPCIIYGFGNKGNLSLLYNLVSKNIPWPLGLYINSRSYLSIENLCFVIRELLEREDISPGIYNLADDIPLSTNKVIELIAESKGTKAKFLRINKTFILFLARIGDFLKLPFNTERLQKLTESYVVSNSKIKTAIGKQLPVSSISGLFKTFQSFSSNA